MAQINDIEKSALSQQLVADVRSIVENGLKQAYDGLNSVVVHTYWNVGKRIVEEEQKGEKRAEYGTYYIFIFHFSCVFKFFFVILRSKFPIREIWCKDRHNF